MKALSISALIMMLLLGACGRLTAQSDYRDNLAKWQAQDASHYRYQLSIGCFCPFLGQMPLTIEVKDGKAIELVGLYDDGERQPSPRTK